MIADQLSLPASVRIVHMPRQIDDRGSLVIGELSALIPFECKRIFMVSDVPAGIARGAHAHRECHQFLIAARGSVVVEVDDGRTSGEIRLDSPAVGLHLPPMIWGVQRDYSADCTLLVLASHPYAYEEYVHDYDEFLALTGAAA